MKIAIVDSRIPFDMERTLSAHGYQVISLPPSERLSAPIASHPDMLIKLIGGELVTTADYCERAGAEISMIYDLTRARCHFTSDMHGERYPEDVIFNSLTMGKRIYARLDSLSPYLKELALKMGYELRHVKQGYPACTALKLSDNAVITADEGLAETLTKDGVRVYRITDGGISLPPYEYGFIGGAAGVDGDKVYFLGDITSHPSRDIILNAIENEGMRAVSLASSQLLDLGGILFAEPYLN
jgi:hypothetical protein